MAQFVAYAVGLWTAVVLVMVTPFLIHGGYFDNLINKLRGPGRTSQRTPADGAPEVPSAGEPFSEFHVATRSFHAGEVIQP